MKENPANSLFWHVTSIAESPFLQDMFLQDHQACAYGSLRPKWTRLAANFEQVHAISQTCPKDHVHEPWGKVDKGNKKVFATALEVHYPKGLCEAIAAAFEIKLIELGWCAPTPTPSNAQAAASTGGQPTQPKLAPMVSEFKAKVCTLSSEIGRICWPKITISTQAAKLLHKFPIGGKCNEEVFLNVENACEALGMVVNIQKDNSTAETIFLNVFGFQWEPEEFVARALDVDHPMASELVNPSILLDEINFHVKGE